MISVIPDIVFSSEPLNGLVLNVMFAHCLQLAPCIPSIQSRFAACIYPSHNYKVTQLGTNCRFQFSPNNNCHNQKFLTKPSQIIPFSCQLFSRKNILKKLSENFAQTNQKPSFCDEQLIFICNAQKWRHPNEDHIRPFLSLTCLKLATQIMRDERQKKSPTKLL